MPVTHITKGWPYLIAIARLSDSEIIFDRAIGTNRHPNFGDFERMMKKMLAAGDPPGSTMKNVHEKIIKVADDNIYIGCRRDLYTGGEPGTVLFAVTPMTFNKFSLRQLLQELTEQFKSGIVEAGMDDDDIAQCGEKALSSKSIIKNRVAAVIEKHADGEGTIQKIDKVLDKAKSVMTENVDAILLRNEQLQETLEISAELKDSTSHFADKAHNIKQAMARKNMMTLICLIGVVVAMLGVLAWVLFG